jgi:hypothetical protein
MRTFLHRQGDTFEAVCDYVDAAGEGVDLDAEEILVASQVRRRNGRLVAALTVLKADQAEQPGRFSLLAPDTASWPAEVLTWDVEFRQGGRIASTEVMQIHVQPDVTRQ